MKLSREKYVGSLVATITSPSFPSAVASIIDGQLMRVDQSLSNHYIMLDNTDIEIGE